MSVPMGNRQSKVGDGEDDNRTRRRGCAGSLRPNRVGWRVRRLGKAIWCGCWFVRVRRLVIIKQSVDGHGQGCYALFFPAPWTGQLTGIHVLHAKGKGDLAMLDVDTQQ